MTTTGDDDESRKQLRRDDITYRHLHGHARACCDVITSTGARCDVIGDGDVTAIETKRSTGRSRTAHRQRRRRRILNGDATAAGISCSDCRVSITADHPSTDVPSRPVSATPRPGYIQPAGRQGLPCHSSVVDPPV